MKVGNVIDGLEVVDVKRVNKMNLIQFTKAVSEYIEMGYKLDVNSSRQVGLVLSVDVFKTEETNLGVTETVTKTVITNETEEDTPSTEGETGTSEVPVKKTRTKKSSE